MPIYKQDAAGKFVPFERTPFPDLEKVLEDWIETNPHLLLEGEDLVIIARQPRTDFDKFLDLLAIDRTGATVVIELKRGETPRDVVAQALEYAAWVDSLSPDQLDEMARDYAHKTKLPDGTGLTELYERAFPDESEDSDSDATRSADRVTFNNRQRLVIVAERISDEVEQTLRYLRTRFGVDVYGVEFSVHKAAGGEIIVSTTTKVGREQVSKTSQPSLPRNRESDEAILARVKTDFMRAAVTDVEEWVLKTEGLSVDHSGGTDHWLRYQGETWIYYYYAAGWLYMSLYLWKQEEIDTLKIRLSKPKDLWTKDGWTVWRFHVATDSDLDAVKDLVSARVLVRQESAP